MVQIQAYHPMYIYIYTIKNTEMLVFTGYKLMSKTTPAETKVTTVPCVAWFGKLVTHIKMA